MDPARPTGAARMKRLPSLALSAFLGLADALPALAPLRAAAMLGSLVIDKFPAVRTLCPRPRPRPRG
jgi:hypothetical protein